MLHKDGFGHGPHMAGIIAGRDNVDGTRFRGIAPDAILTSIKVGTSIGPADVSQMLAALDCVVAHRNDDPQNSIRIIKLSYGTDCGICLNSPSALAVENASIVGINVVVAAGNAGSRVTSPATDAFPIVVGSLDTLGTTNPADNVVSSFSASGRHLVWSRLVWPILVGCGLGRPGLVRSSLVGHGLQRCRLVWGQLERRSLAVTAIVEPSGIVKINPNCLSKR